MDSLLILPIDSRGAVCGLHTYAVLNILVNLSPIRNSCLNTLIQLSAGKSSFRGQNRRIKKFVAISRLCAIKVRCPRFFLHCRYMPLGMMVLYVALYTHQISTQSFHLMRQKREISFWKVVAQWECQRGLGIETPHLEVEILKFAKSNFFWVYAQEQDVIGIYPRSTDA